VEKRRGAAAGGTHADRQPCLGKCALVRPFDRPDECAVRTNELLVHGNELSVGSDEILVHSDEPLVGLDEPLVRSDRLFVRSAALLVHSNAPLVLRVFQCIFAELHQNQPAQMHTGAAPGLFHVGPVPPPGAGGSGGGGGGSARSGDPAHNGQWKNVIEATKFVTLQTVLVWSGAKPGGNDPAGPLYPCRRLRPNRVVDGGGGSIADF